MRAEHAVLLWVAKRVGCRIKRVQRRPVARAKWFRGALPPCQAAAAPAAAGVLLLPGAAPTAAAAVDAPPQAQAVIEVLEEKAPDEKVLVFSEFPNTLRQIKSMLPEIGLQSRDLIGGSSAGACCAC